MSHLLRYRSSGQAYTKPGHWLFPFLFVRIVDFLFLKYGLHSFNLATGDIGILVAMGLLMEIIVVILLLIARSVIESLGCRTSLSASRMIA